MRIHTKTISYIQSQKLDWGHIFREKLLMPHVGNIRRERRCELMARVCSMDWLRMAPMDQIKPHHILEMNLWQEMYGWD